MSEAADLRRKAKAAREHADQGRRLAREMADDDHARAMQFALELEQKAASLEQAAASDPKPRS